MNGRLSSMPDLRRLRCQIVFLYGHDIAAGGLSGIHGRKRRSRDAGRPARTEPSAVLDQPRRKSLGTGKHGAREATDIAVKGSLQYIYVEALNDANL